MRGVDGVGRVGWREGRGGRAGIGRSAGIGAMVVTNRAETAERHYLVTYMIFMRIKVVISKNCINFIAGKVTMRE